MNRNLYIGAAGAQAAQAALDVTAHNLANVSTAGYKPRQAQFQTLLYANAHAGSDTMAGAGVQVHAAETTNQGGSLRQTGRTLDFAFDQENRYFAVETDGGVAYTRTGDFKLSPQAEGDYLVTAEGRYVLGPDGERLLWEEGKMPAFGVYSFANESGLQRADGGVYLETADSGPAQADAGPVRSGWLSEGGVDLAREMVDMMRWQRGFQMSSKVMQIADELAQTVNSLRG